MSEQQCGFMLYRCDVCFSLCGTRDHDEELQSSMRESEVEEKRVRLVQDTYEDKVTSVK